MPSSASATPRLSRPTASRSSSSPPTARSTTCNCCAAASADVAFVRGGSADPVKDEAGRPDLAGQPVLRAAVVLLPHRCGEAGRPQDRHADLADAAQGPAHQRRQAGQRRARHHGADVPRQPHGPGRAEPVEPRADARHRGAAGRPARRHRAGLGAAVAAGAEAAARPRHPVDGLRSRATPIRGASPSCSR